MPHAVSQPSLFDESEENRSEQETTPPLTQPVWQSNGPLTATDSKRFDPPSVGRFVYAVRVDGKQVQQRNKFPALAGKKSRVESIIALEWTDQRGKTCLAPTDGHCIETFRLLEVTWIPSKWAMTFIPIRNNPETIRHWFKKIESMTGEKDTKQLWLHARMVVSDLRFDSNPASKSPPDLKQLATKRFDFPPHPTSPLTVSIQFGKLHVAEQTVDLTRREADLLALVLSSKRNRFDLQRAMEISSPESLTSAISKLNLKLRTVLTRNGYAPQVLSLGKSNQPYQVSWEKTSDPKD